MIHQLPVQDTPFDSEAETRDRIGCVLQSAPVVALGSVLARSGLVVKPDPIVRKYLDGKYLRLMFPVVRGGIELGSVVSIVCLYDCERGQTLYAHPMHAGPDVNPLLKHLDGPMAKPKAQTGADGDRATQRIMEHKRALWARFIRERKTLGVDEAGRRWRAGYYWALQRLYYCTRCTPCRWGNPFFDGPAPNVNARPTTRPAVTRYSPSRNGDAAIVNAVLASDAWKVEVAYARRGGFRVSNHPRLIRDLESGFTQLVFETDATLIQAGSLVALAVTYEKRRGEVLAAHCLCAGPDPEIQFLRGDVSLSLPRPQPGEAAESARSSYASWRRDAWSQFWIDELEGGLEFAGQKWIQGLWTALDELFGGNDTSWHESQIRSEDRVPDGAVSIPIESILNIGGRCFVGHAARHGHAELRASEVSTLMVNLGRRCNQTCRHCHIDAGPHRTEEMSRETVDIVVDVLRRHRIETLDITGGAPEMNPHFRHLVGEASPLVSRIVDRCNLTILFEPGYEDLAEFLAGNGVEITASLPCYQADNVDEQRGNGTFEKSIAALQRLNGLGYGRPGTGLALNLVHNPIGVDFAPPEPELERSYKQELSNRFGITFNRLFAMNNMPINRFRDGLSRSGRLPGYMAQTVGAFNLHAMDGLMCKHMVSVGWDGRLHDCDFNQALGIPLAQGQPAHISEFDLALTRERSINTGPHCFTCAAGAGSSCSGALAEDSVATHSRQELCRSEGVGVEQRQ